MPPDVAARVAVRLRATPGLLDAVFPDPTHHLDKDLP